MVTSAGTSIPRVLGTGLPRIPEASLFVYVLGVARSIDGGKVELPYHLVSWSAFKEEIRGVLLIALAGSRCG